MSMIVSLVARKGGVGKTSAALNLAGAALGDGLRRVLLIDMDSQASLSKAVLGPSVVDALRPDQTVQAVAERTRSAGDVVRETAIPGLLIVPAFHDLRVPADGALHLAGVDADLVLIDTPPDTRDTSVRCALLASNVVISPVVPEGWGLQSVHGVQQLLMSAGLVSNQSMVFAGWLVSMVQRIAMHTVCEDTLRRLHGATVFNVTLPHAAAFKEAAAAGIPITQHAPKSAAAKAVRGVWNETLDRVEAAMKRGAA
jgi:cellulose biosynthesis protein BcsQ